MIELRQNFRKAVVDTGPLFDFLTLAYSDSCSPAKRIRVLQSNDFPPVLIISSLRQGNLLNLFQAIRTVLITPHVVAELQGLLKLTGKDFIGFWHHSLQLLSQKNGDERLLLTLAQMQAAESLRQSLYTIGPTDTALIHLAKVEGCRLLTKDRDLMGRALREGVHCDLVDQLI